MIRVAEDLAVEIEEAAAESLKQYPDWFRKNTGELLGRKFANLEQLGQVADFLPPEPLDNSMVNESLLRILVELAVIQTLLDGNSSYRAS